MTRLLLKVCIFVVVAMTAVSCRSFHTLNGGKSAQGAPYEVLVVCNGAEWESPVGERLRALLSRPVEMINQQEPMFKLLRVAASDFKNLLPSHRNILKVVISSEVSEAAVKVQYDVEAAPQVVMTLQAPSVEAATRYLDEHGDSLLQALEIAERDRTIAYAAHHNNKALGELMLSKFGVKMQVPKGYTLRDEGDNFVWASYEFPAASQGFFAYSYPYKGKAHMTVDDLLFARNLFAQRIPGPSEGSYMTTVSRIPNVDGTEYIPFTPDYRVVRINGRVWIEMRGLWEVENDFMGGPFVSYTTVNEATREVFTLDCYVYSPKLGKRNFLRPLEHLVYLVDFVE